MKKMMLVPFLAVLSAVLTACGGNLALPTKAPESTACDSHDWIKDSDEIPSDCESAGMTAAYICSKCGEKKPGEVISAKGHNFVPQNDAVAATCKKDGKTESQKCTVCGKTIEGKTLEKTGHVFDLTQAYKPATCERAGTQEVMTCIHCGVVSVGAGAEPMLGHSGNSDKCERCGKTYVQLIAEYIKAKGTVDADGQMVSIVSQPFENETIVYRYRPSENLVGFVYYVEQEDYSCAFLLLVNERDADGEWNMPWRIQYEMKKRDMTFEMQGQMTESDRAAFTRESTTIPVTEWSENMNAEVMEPLNHLATQMLKNILLYMPRNFIVNLALPTLYYEPKMLGYSALEVESLS